MSGAEEFVMVTVVSTRLAMVAAFLLIPMIAGCGGGAPTPPFKTFPVAGKVVYKGPGRVERLERGKVWFQSKSDPNITAVGSISDDGSFIMTTFSKGESWAGMPAGEYKVRLEPPPRDDGSLIHPNYLDYNRSGITVTLPVSGELTISVERPR